MPHIDEGVLHAYLDGALDEYPVVEAEQVREHLDRCGACRARLDEERAVRARAQSILGLAVPAVDAPPLEELRARARHLQAPARPSPGTRISRIGWVASVILALGTGWLLRGGSEPVERRGRAAATPAASPEAAEGSRVPDSERVAERRPDAATGGASERDAAPAAVDASRGGTPGDTDLLSARTAPGRATGGPAADAPASLQVSAVAEADGGRREAAESDVALLVDVPVQRDVADLAPIQPRLLADGPVAETDGSARGREADADGPDDPAVRNGRDQVGVVTSASRLTPLAGLAAAGRASVERERDREEVDYPDAEPYSLVVPGLDVIEVRFRGGVRPEGQIVLQRLGSGDTLTVIHLPPGIHSSTLEAPASGELQVTVQRETGSIVMRAPRSEEELLDLMEQLLGAP